MKIGIVGCMGRVGSVLVKEVNSHEWPDIELAGGTALPEDVKDDHPFFITSNPDELFQIADAVIDFTSPESTKKHAWLAAKHKKSLIIGTTGLTLDDEHELEDAANETTIIYAANMSVGVNVLLNLVEKAAATLADDWDIEIFEAHHKHKVDAPSGTALAIGKAAASGRGIELEDKADWARHGQTGARKRGHIGFSVARGGDVVGEHRAYFYSEGERIELTHVATNRALFARGALRAAMWSEDKKPGLYSMKDVLGL